MRVTTDFRRSLLGALALVFVVAACASSGRPAGATHPKQAGRCLPESSDCTTDGECCTLWCVNLSCERKPAGN